MPKRQQASPKKSLKKVNKVKAEKLFDDFLTDVVEVISSGAGDDSINLAIEESYDKYIFNNTVGMTKAYFIAHLYRCPGGDIYERVVNHLFTPMAWSKLTIQTYYGIKNTMTDRLVTLMRNEFDDVGADYLLVECVDQPDLSPMLVRDKRAAEKFIAILNRPSTSVSHDPHNDENPPSSSKMVNLDLDENINTNNLEVVEVEILFK